MELQMIRELHPLEEAGYKLPANWKYDLPETVKKTCFVCKKRFNYEGVHPRQFNYCSMKCRMIGLQ
jgi:hypothetical protein